MAALRFPVLIALCALAPLTSCGPRAAEREVSTGEEAYAVETAVGRSVRTPSLHVNPPYREIHDTLFLMQTIVQPAADAFWGSAGWVIDAEGTHNLRPTTDEGWAKVVTGAATVAQMGNLLMTPPFNEGRGDDWLQFAGALVEIGMRAQQAAESRDEEMIFEVGATMDRVCEGCHTIYVDPEAVFPPPGLSGAQ